MGRMQLADPAYTAPPPAPPSRVLQVKAGDVSKLAPRLIAQADKVARDPVQGSKVSVGGLEGHGADVCRVVR